MKFTGICYKPDDDSYVAITETGELWEYGWVPFDERKDEEIEEQRWLILAEAPVVEK